MHGMNSLVIQPESHGTSFDKGFAVSDPVGDSELLLCHGMRDLSLQLSKSSIYLTKPGKP